MSEPRYYDNFTRVPTLRGITSAKQAWGVYDNKHPMGRTKFGLDVIRCPDPPAGSTGCARFVLRPYCCKAGKGVIEQKDLFQGVTIRSKQHFGLLAKDEHMEFESKIRLTNVPSGAIAAFFVFADPSGGQDEIDFEFLGKELPNGNVWLNSWHNGAQLGVERVEGGTVSKALRAVPNVNFTKDWNTYTIKWYPGKVEHWVQGQHEAVPHQRQLVDEHKFVPTRAMDILFQIWVPTSGMFPEAYDAQFKPALPGRTTRDPRSWCFDVDWVRVIRYRVRENKTTKVEVFPQFK